VASAASGGPSGAPAELLEWVRRYADVSPEEDIDKILAGVRRALRHSLAHPGRDREAAFSLLAADGLLTLVIERLADSADPEARIRAAVAALAGEAAGLDDVSPQGPSQGPCEERSG
jgi:hypothetical protein